ncbi:hypothetical protein [Psychroserpens sp. MEBiC05023]
MKTAIKLKMRIVILILCIPILVTGQQNRSNKLNVVTFNKYKDYTNVDKGFWTAKIEDDTICVTFTDHTNDRKQTYLIVNCFDALGVKILTEDSSEFSIDRLAGTLRFKGAFNGHKGSGTFSFQRHDVFENFLKQEGFDVTDELYYFKLYLGDISKDYILGIKALGYQPSIRELGRLVYHDASLDYITDITKLFNKEIALDMISSFAIHNISVDYIKALKQLKGLEAAPQMIKKLAIHEVSVDDVKSLQEFGFEDFSLHEIKKAKIHNVNSTFIKNAQKRGYNYTKLHDYIKLKIHNKEQ